MRNSELYTFHRRGSVTNKEINQLKSAGVAQPSSVQAEWRYYIETNSKLNESEIKQLHWLLSETFDVLGTRESTFLGEHRSAVEIGPRLNFETPWASTAREICHSVGVGSVTRIERARRFGFANALSPNERSAVENALSDRMTQVAYVEAPETLQLTASPEPVRTIPVLQEGLEALRKANKDFGLAMDEQDLEMYLDLFKNRLQRDPTDVELFSLGQGNSEHCRHGYFRGNLVLDGKPLGTSLMKIVKAPWAANPNNSVIAFHDDSSAIEGRRVRALVPEKPGQTSQYKLDARTLHPTLTAETHNFPTGIAPYPGAATGTGGRIRDNQAVGRGGMVVASGVGYSVGNLHIPGYDQPWEQDGHVHPENLASPLEILISGSNGASDYGNCFGEPLIIGHVRTFGQQVGSSYRSWFKPVMYSEGVGMIDARHAEKGKPQVSMLIVQVGGPAYRIGLGGGAASSLMSGDNKATLDFNAVQRGDPEMEQRVNRVIRACIELGDTNPIVSAHDLGAGGDSNALPEIVDPVGGRIELRAIPVGDQTLSVLEIWGNESQERNALLLRPEDITRFEGICKREHAPYAVVGEVTGDGNLVVFDASDGSTPVNLPLEPILGDIPPKTVNLTSLALETVPLNLPSDLNLRDALGRVLRLVSVGSKSWLTRKVDRSVTGLIAQQQGVGPLETPLSDYAVVAHGLFGNSGTVMSQGERPIIGLISPGAQGRMSVGEALTNLMGARISDLGDIRASANWMWPAKLEGEGARLYEAAVAMATMMTELGMAVDGGKDSLSMAAQTPKGLVKAPGQLVIAPYAVMPDVRQKVTAELKAEGNILILIDLSDGHARLGGSALAQAYNQLGDDCPDLTDASLLGQAFVAVQGLNRRGRLRAVHDRSDGGVVVAAIEMAIAGNLGLELELPASEAPLATLFNEELGVLIEVTPSDSEAVRAELEADGVVNYTVGRVGAVAGHVSITVGSDNLLNMSLHELRGIWEETSSQLELLQANPDTVKAEFELMQQPRVSPDWKLTYKPTATIATTSTGNAVPLVAVLREAGTNGDREMVAAFLAAGFDVWDVTMSDLLEGTINLSQFRGVVFPGGFSFGDVLDSGKGWAGVIRFNEKLAQQFAEFYARPDTFSLGVCNGAQLMALLGWAPFVDLSDEDKPRFIHNASGRFESRLVTVEIQDSPAMMFEGMVGSRLGVWVAHGEGRLHVPQPTTMKTIADQKLVALRFVEPEGRATMAYPFNPNGSPDGITALCSPNGRHLAMMPHPERMSNALWQWPWLPDDWKNLEASPWLKMFQNAKIWCEETQNLTSSSN
jgi:phosphoribosylformylglycinamidine synthase